jgi:hypothetical protein
MSPFITTVRERGAAEPDVAGPLVVVPGVAALRSVLDAAFDTALDACGIDAVRGGGGGDTVSSVAVQAASRPASATPASAARRCAHMVSSVSR